MGVLQSFRRLYKADYPQQFQSLVDQLSVTINQGFESLYNMSQNNITLEDNVSCSVNTFSVSVDAKGNPTTATTVALTTSATQPIQQVMVGKVVNQTNSASYPTGGVFVSWTTSGTNLVINNITGLTAGNQYQITITSYN